MPRTEIGRKKRVVAGIAPLGKGACGSAGFDGITGGGLPRARTSLLIDIGGMPSFDETECAFVIGRGGLEVAVTRLLGNGSAKVTNERVSSKRSPAGHLRATDMSPV